MIRLTEEQREEFVKILEDNNNIGIEENDFGIDIVVSEQEMFEFTTDGALKKILGKSGYYNEYYVIPGAEDLLQELQSQSETSLSFRFDEKRLVKVKLVNNKMSINLINGYGAELETIDSTGINPQDFDNIKDIIKERVLEKLTA